MDRIDVESFWLGSPAFADELIGREALKGLQSATEVVGADEVGEVLTQLVVVVEPFDGRIFDCPVHAFDLAVGPGVVRLGQPVLDGVGFADHVEAHRPGIDGVPVSGLLGEFDAIACWE